jgi:uncharacterized repeat protein (TIGR01451 family)
MTIFRTMLALALAALSFATQAQVSITGAGGPLFCDARFYQTRANADTGTTSSSRTYVITYPTLTAGANPVNLYAGLGGGGTNDYLPIPLNNLAFNPADNYLYAMYYDFNAGGLPNNRLYRLGQSGAELVGTIAGLTNTFVTTGATFDRQGRYYFAGQGAGNIQPSAIYRVDTIPVSGPVTIAQTYNLSPVITNFGDFAFFGNADGVNGTLYGATGTVKYAIALNAGASTATATTNTVAPTVGGIGSAFYDRPTNEIYVFNNAAATFSLVQNIEVAGPATSSNIAVNAPGFIVPGFVNSATDGASCVQATIEAADVRVAKSVSPTTTRTFGQTVTFTVVASNVPGITATSPAQSVTVADTLPSGLTFTSASVTAGTYTQPNGPWVIPNLASGASQTLTLVATVIGTNTSTGVITNVATVTGSNRVGTTTLVALPDPIPTNNSGSATVSFNLSSNIQITKTNVVSGLTAGQTTSYTVTVSSLSGSDVANAVLKDTAAAGLQCSALGTPPCTATGGSVCPVVGAGPGQLSLANLQGAGVTVPLLKVGGSVAVTVVCGVVATGQ